MPCSNCVRRKIEDSCVLNPAKSNRCDPCVKSGISCDGYGLSVAAVEVKGLDIIQRGFNLIDKLERAEQSKQAALENAMADSTYQDWSAVAKQSKWDSLGLGAFINHSSASGVGGSSLGVVRH
ncbi:hypothetical protein HZ326_31201 [Fusarium oxysporum f. sp. albedinis]|nr:hypothetical protein HZ326_31201 [Fusarium oxysporum f. sp. albedinis]